MSEAVGAHLTRSLLQQAVQYYQKAERYVEQSEPTGALIFYKLSANNLHNIESILRDSQAIKTLKKEIPELKVWCQADCLSVKQALNLTLSKIQPLQEEVKRRQRKDDGEEIECTEVSNLLFHSAEDCVFFSDISGLDEVKNKIYAGLLYPLLYPRLYPKVSRGILFYGAPGTGKSLLAKATANELQTKDPRIRVLFYPVSGAELKGKYVGETEKNIRKWFTCASRQAQEYPTRCGGEQVSKVISVIFIDEVDSVAGDRSKDETGMMSNSVNALLQQMDGIASAQNVVVMAATNFPWRLDTAFLRRFDTKLHVTLPNAEAITRIFELAIDHYYHHALRPPRREKALPTRPARGLKCLENSICQPSEVTDRLYPTLPYLKLPTEELRALARAMIDEKRNFSSSDVSKLAKRALEEAAQRARTNGAFVKTKITYQGRESEYWVSKLSPNLPSGEVAIVSLPRPYAWTLEGEIYADISLVSFLDKITSEVEKFVREVMSTSKFQRFFFHVNDVINFQQKTQTTIRVLFPVVIEVKLASGRTTSVIFYLRSKIDPQEGWFQRARRLLPFAQGNLPALSLYQGKGLEQILVKDENREGYQAITVQSQPFFEQIIATKTLELKEQKRENLLSDLVRENFGKIEKHLVTPARLVPVNEVSELGSLRIRAMEAEERENSVTFDLRLSDFQQALLQEQIQTVSQTDLDQLYSYSQGKEISK